MRSHAKASSAATRHGRAGRMTLVALFALGMLCALVPSLASAQQVFGPSPFSPIDGSGTGVTLNHPWGSPWMKPTATSS